MKIESGHPAALAATQSQSNNRARFQRTRTGCVTCKIRRVKCDEQRPSCHKCRSTGRKCDGYSPPKPPARRHKEVYTVLMVINHGTWLTSHPEVGRALQYFCEVSAPALANYDTHSFWNGIVLQACHVEESIQHLVIAISYLDQHMRRNDVDVRTVTDHRFFLHHYGKALSLLSNHHDVVVVLIACLLLVLCEDYRCSTYSAITHIQAARKLLLSAHSVSSQSVLYEVDTIVQSLIIHSPELSAHHLCISRLQYNITTGTDQIRPTVCQSKNIPEFGTADDASASLKALVPSCLGSSQGSDAPTTRFHVVPSITQDLNHWLERLNELTARSDRFDMFNVRIPLYKLRVRYLCLQILSRCAAFGNEMLYDNYANDLDGLTKKMAVMLDLGADDLLAPLFFIACKYRDPVSRRRATEMLRYQVCGHEGLVLAEIAGQIIDIEECGINNPTTYSDIPERSRLRPIAVQDDNLHEIPSLIYVKPPYDLQSASLLHVQLKSNACNNLAGAVSPVGNEILQRALNFEFMK